ncbi:hypothetical protein [Chloroflexus sp.]|uniref:hypothetical protein n=1 Tax=Chloroflexus sp. TaxID=1904827 RepID=UPI002ACDCBAD|nr:hypothetical protein [Chloroflexus sp.]
MPQAYYSRETLFGTPDPVDPLMTTLHELCHHLRVQFPQAVIYAPLGVGQHLDHQLTCRIAAQLAGPVVMWYEDFPYVARDGELERRLAQLDWPLRPLARDRRADECALGCDCGLC